jgi:predicted transcriptional regulator
VVSFLPKCISLFAKLLVCKRPIQKGYNISDIIEKYDDILRIVSIFTSVDAFNLFLHAERSFLPSDSLLNKLQMSNMQYCKAIQRLRMLGLIEKKDGTYHHTVAGSILYDQIVLQIAQLSKHKRELRIIRTLEKTNHFSENDMKKFFHQITKVDNLLSIFERTQIIDSYDDMVKTVCKRVELASNEILIATRISIDEVIASLIYSIKRGVKVRVLVDEGLIAQYREAYYRNVQKSDSLARRDKYEEERIKLVENPWYQSGVKIERRVGKVPFGLMIWDGSEVGIESVNCLNPRVFAEGILLRGSSQICNAMLKLYEEWWSNSYGI